jgi:hypothetical protein
LAIVIFFCEVGKNQDPEIGVLVTKVGGKKKIKIKIKIKRRKKKG